MVKPLKDLIAEADRILGQTKEASVSVTDEVSSLANTLSFATAIEDQFIQQKEASAEYNPEFEKAAKLINKVAAEIEWDILKKTEQFEKAASAKGYTGAQVEEALSKIAAAKIKKNLATLVSLGGVPEAADTNSLVTKKVKNHAEEKRTSAFAKSFKGAT